MTKNTRNIVILVILLAILGYVALPLFSQEDAAVVTSNEDRLAAVTEAVALLDQIQAINFDFQILETPEFKSLVDIATPLLNLPVGRSNPFAPVK
jgi:hypothetical protein